MINFKGNKSPQLLNAGLLLLMEICRKTCLWREVLWIITRWRSLVDLLRKRFLMVFYDFIEFCENICKKTRFYCFNSWKMKLSRFLFEKMIWFPSSKTRLNYLRILASFLGLIFQMVRK